MYRKGKGDAPIILEFKGNAEKEKLIKNTKIFVTRGNSDKLTSAHLGIKADTKKVYVSEALTHKTKKILSATKSLMKKGCIKHSWVSRGNVLIRKQDSDSPVLINSFEQLNALSTNQ